MNNLDESEIKSLVRDVLSEKSDKSLTYLSNKAFLINNLTNDEEIECMIKNDYTLNFEQDMHHLVKMINKSFAPFMKDAFENIEENIKKEKSEGIINELIDDIYDEIRFDDFYEKYKEKVKKHVNGLLEKKLVSSEVLSIEGYLLEPEEVMNILRDKGYVVETIFNEYNEGFASILKK